MPSLRSERSRDTRDRIIQAAIELLAEKSYREVSLVDIEARSGVSRGSIPHHFGTKDGLLQAVIERLREDAEKRYSVEVPAGAESIAFLASRAALAIQGPRGRALLSLLFEATDPDSPIHASFATIHSTARGFYRRFLGRPEVVAGLPPGTDLDVMAAVVFGAVTGVNHQWMLNPDAVDLKKAHLTLFRSLFHFLEAADDREPTHMSPTA